MLQNLIIDLFTRIFLFGDKKIVAIILIKMNLIGNAYSALNDIYRENQLLSTFHVDGLFMSLKRLTKIIEELLSVKNCLLILV